ncbi:hypothetical protein KQX54_019866 [Cotesia glomerata]|uniref:Uncharacterized protein n=1 Tax=Cotesia glomerata TaxID=32391 RepID=A0AAV7HVZ0_COTGL|nr:hypothetical protein KQX54_019866 [Cotesia glomerata]
MRGHLQFHLVQVESIFRVSPNQRYINASRDSAGCPGNWSQVQVQVVTSLTAQNNELSKSETFPYGGVCNAYWLLKEGHSHEQNNVRLGRESSRGRVFSRFCIKLLILVQYLVLSPRTVRCKDARVPEAGPIVSL